MLTLIKLTFLIISRSSPSVTNSSCCCRIAAVLFLQRQFQLGSVIVLQTAWPSENHQDTERILESIKFQNGTLSPYYRWQHCSQAWNVESGGFLTTLKVKFNVQGRGIGLEVG